MRRRPRSQKLVSEINITPFTDVILVVLIIFLVATPLIFRSSVKVELPQTSTMQEPPRDINITITASGQALLEDTKYNIRFDLELLKFNLSRMIKNNAANTTIIINGDKSVEYNFVIKVVEAISQIGIKHISLATEFRK